MKRTPFVLVILDGLGLSDESKYNPFAHANLPNLKTWLRTYPNAVLKASGTAVGLLPNMSGNSAVGLLTIGAGRIVPQAIKRIHDDIINGQFFKNEILNTRLKGLEISKKSLHIIGLVSDAAVHSSLEHLKALLKIISNYKIDKIFIHAFLDGRDSLPISAKKFLEEIDHYWQNLTGKNAPFASLAGRYYAMDRDKNWYRTEQVYNLLIGANENNTKIFNDWQEAINYWYSNGLTDEFILPTKLSNFCPMADGDALICFNIRADRARQILQLFLNDKKPSIKEKKTDVNLSWIITFTSYKPEFNVDILYPPLVIENTFSDQLALYNKTMFSIAETEKYAHITYFFNGGRELARNNETRMLIPSMPVGKTYANNPEMSARQITKAVIDSLKEMPKDFYLINYANADMVGHSGDFNATIKALEVLDKQLELLYEEVVQNLNGTLCVTSDHGNAESLYDPKANQPQTSHTANPVFFILINKKTRSKNIKLPISELSNIAPFILKLLNIPVAKEMSTNFSNKGFEIYAS